MSDDEIPEDLRYEAAKKRAEEVGEKKKSLNQNTNTAAHRYSSPGGCVPNPGDALRGQSIQIPGIC